MRGAISGVFSCSSEIRFVCKPILKEIDGFWDSNIFLVSFEFEKFGASDMEFNLKFTMLESMRTENHNLKRKKKNHVDDILGPLLIREF